MDLLDNTTDQQSLISERGLNRIYAVLLILGLIYGFVLFVRYWIVAQQFNNPLLPDYTINFIYGNQAFTGSILTGGMTVSYITKLFHLKSALIILLFTIALMPFTDILYSLLN